MRVSELQPFTGQRAVLFDHCIGKRKQVRRHLEPHRLGGLEVKDQFELRRQLHRQIARLFASQNAIYIGRGAAEEVDYIRPIGCQSADFDVVFIPVNY